MGLGFEAAVEQVHAALEGRDAAAVAAVIGDLTVGMKLDDLSAAGQVCPIFPLPPIILPHLGTCCPPETSDGWAARHPRPGQHAGLRPLCYAARIGFAAGCEQLLQGGALLSRTAALDHQPRSDPHACWCP